MTGSNSESRRKREQTKRPRPQRGLQALRPHREKAPPATQLPSGQREPGGCRSQSPCCSGCPTWRGHGGGARAPGRGLAAQGAQGAGLGHGLHHHRAWRAQVGLPGGRHDLEDAACKHKARALSQGCALRARPPRGQKQMRPPHENPKPTSPQRGKAQLLGRK